MVSHMYSINQTIEWLNREKILSAIESDNLANLADLKLFDTIDSTNTYLLTSAKAGAPSGSVCFAEEQTGGRGRRGRSWFSPFGTNIYCSVLWHFSALENISGLSIAVAVMVANVLRKYGISSGIQLKWPNDILFDGRKLSGILIERIGNKIVIGVGLNLFLPKEAEANWICVQDITGREVTRNYLAGLLVNELLAQLPVYAARGLGAFVDEWRKYDVLGGRSITVQTPDKMIEGVMQGINEQGELILKDADGVLQEFCYGEVSVRI